MQYTDSIYYYSASELNVFSKWLATYLSDSHVGVGKYYCHYAEKGAEAGLVICRNLNWSG